jgi:hypothetical protein
MFWGEMTVKTKISKNISVLSFKNYNLNRVECYSVTIATIYKT